MISSEEQAKIGRLTAYLWLAAFIISSVTLIVVWFKLGIKGRPLALHYTVIAGVDTIINDYYALVFPGLSFGILILHLILAKLFKSISDVLPVILAFTSALAALAIVFTVYLLTRIN